jgi:L-ascorbate metabolism protein UlaG (beta-lactamase superfamily)
MRRSLVLAFSLVLAITAMVVPAAGAQGGGTVTLEWLGWNAWRVTSPTGRVLLLNPFLNNPDSVTPVESITRADAILVTNGHGDEVGQSVAIAQNTGARIIPGAFELGTWFMESGLPADQVTRVSPGERVLLDGITVRIVNGVHGVGLTGGTATSPTSGIAGSFFITFENGWTLFYGGSSAATQDMALWARLYQPHAAILNMGGNKEPMDFALAVSLLMTNNPNLSTVFPGHHRFMQPAGSTTITEVDQAMRAMGINLSLTEPAPGQPFTFTP